MKLLAQAGVAYLRAHPNNAGLKVTANLSPKDGWLRICFDPGVKPEYYAAQISHAHAVGLRVVGRPSTASSPRCTQRFRNSAS